MAADPHSSETRSDGGFHAAARKAVEDLGTALGAVVRRLSTGDSVAADLRRTLSIDTKLSTQIAAVVGATDPLAAGLRVPGPRSMRRFLDSAAERGIEPAVVGEARAAYSRFEDVVDRYAGDRSSFDSMLGQAQSMTVGVVDLTHRRAAFRAMSHVLGAQCDVRLRCLAVHYSTPDGSPGDLLATALDLNLFRGVRRLRSEAPVCLIRNPGVQMTGSSVPESVYRTEWLDDQQDTAPAAPSMGIPEYGEPARGLLTAFSSRPTPAVHVVEAEHGYRRTMLGPTAGIGNSACVDLSFGQIERDFGRLFYGEAGRGSSRVIGRVSVLLPTRRIVTDVMIPRGSLGQGSAWATVYGRFFELDRGHPERWKDERLPFGDHVEHLGGNLADLDEAGVSGYRGVLFHALDRLGWTSREFDVFRVTFEYPVLYSVIHVPVGVRRPGE